MNEPDQDEIDLLCLLRASRALLQRALADESASPREPERRRRLANLVTALNMTIYLEENKSTTKGN